MLSSQSLKKRLLWQLVLASAVLIAIFSTILYSVIKTSIYEEASEQLIKQARFLAAKKVSLDEPLLKTLDISVRIIPKPPFVDDEPTVVRTKEDGRYYLSLYYPYDFASKSYLKLKKDVTSTQEFLKRLLRYILLTNIITLFITIIIAYALSSSISYYIKKLTAKLSKLDEERLKPIRLRDLPAEFQPLGNSINRLINQIATYIKYQKELYIGIAHELKTPLAVMKLKNEVTLLKDRTPKEYKETIRLTIETIDSLNKMIENLLRIGRQEADQFEPPVEIDIIGYLQKKSENYKLLAHNAKKELKTELRPSSYTLSLQPTLLDHILQNFIQNAIKFTKEGGTIVLRTTPITNGIKIEVIDEGPGIDESKDLFAPFRRQGKKSGVGLGLFLAKSAAEAMGANISLKNRKDGRGAIATLIIPSKLVCPLC